MVGAVPNLADRSGAQTRIIAIDLARFVAIVGMIAAHVVMPVSSLMAGTAPQPVADAITVLVNGNASTLFAVIGGASMVLATRGQLARGLRGAAMLSTATRASLVLLLGLVLTGFGAPVYVVLHYFGASMLLAMPLLLAPTVVVGAVAAVLVLGGPWLLVAVRAARWGDELDPWSTDLLAGNPIAPVVDLVFTGEYPAVTWVAYLAIGMLVARLVLRGGVPGRLVGVGLAVVGGAATVCALLVSAAVVSALVPGWSASTGIDTWSLQHVLLVGTGGPPGIEPWWQLTAVAHTGTIGDIVRGVGVALVVLGGLLVVLPPERRTPFVLRPLRAAGAAPLTLYSIHVVALALTFSMAFLVPGAELLWAVQGVGAWLVHVVGAILLGALLTALGARGPLEAGVSALAVRAGEWTTPAAPPRRPPRS